MILYHIVSLRGDSPPYCLLYCIHVLLNKTQIILKNEFSDLTLICFELFLQYLVIFLRESTWSKYSSFLLVIHLSLEAEYADEDESMISEHEDAEEGDVRGSLSGGANGKEGADSLCGGSDGKDSTSSPPLWRI
jgi:hypothetical protein